MFCETIPSFKRQSWTTSAKSSVEEGIGIARLVIETTNGSVNDFAFFTKKKLKQFRALTNVINNRMVASAPPILDEDEKSAKYNRGSTLRWLLEFMRPYRKRLLFGILFSVLLAGFNLIPPYLLQILIDSVLISNKPSQGLFVYLTLVLLVSFGVITVLSMLQKRLPQHSWAEGSEQSQGQRLRSRDQPPHFVH